MWREVSAQIAAANSGVRPPENLAERALQKAHAEEGAAQSVKLPGLIQRIQLYLLRTFNLLRAQAYLIKREIWPASSGIMLLGIMVGLLSNHAEIISYISPIIAAGCLALLYGPDHDPAHELVLATPTSAWKILLARLSIVSSFNLVLSLLASVAMLIIVPPDLLGSIILGWLTPMAFLSALALLLSLWIGTGKGICIAYGLWILQYFNSSNMPGNVWYSTTWKNFETAYRNFWQSPGLLLTLSVVLLIIALVSTRFTEGKLDTVRS